MNKKIKKKKEETVEKQGKLSEGRHTGHGGTCL
jgi:hypothetical protein